MRILRKLSRRHFLGGAAALPLAGLFQHAYADPIFAKRIIFLYFPDGVPGASQAGDASLWHCTGTESNFQLPHIVQPLADWKENCVFFL